MIMKLCQKKTGCQGNVLLKICLCLLAYITEILYSSPTLKLGFSRNIFLLLRVCYPTLCCHYLGIKASLKLVKRT